MPDLSYSSDAENVLNKFYGVDTVVYVEGRDDVPFWEHMFSTFSDYSVKVNDVGGFPEVKKYIDKIEAGEIDAVVACDADFSRIGCFAAHSNILRSYGYSIENSMICHKSIKKIIRAVARVPLNSIDDSSISNWFDQLVGSTKNLVIHDIANHILKKGKLVAGVDCARFMKNKGSPELCPAKIKKYLDQIDFKLSDRLEADIKDSILASGRDEYDFLRGHFLFSVSLRYVKSIIKDMGKKSGLPIDLFFGVLFIAFEGVFSETHSHYSYYKNIVRGVVVNT